MRYLACCIYIVVLCIVSGPASGEQVFFPERVVSDSAGFLDDDSVREFQLIADVLSDLGIKFRMLVYTGDKPVKCSRVSAVLVSAVGEEYIQESVRVVLLSWVRDLSTGAGCYSAWISLDLANLHPQKLAVRVALQRRLFCYCKTVHMTTSVFNPCFLEESERENRVSFCLIYAAKEFLRIVWGKE